MMLGECLIILFFVFFSYLLDKESWSARTTVQVTGIIVYTLDNYSTLVFRLRASPFSLGLVPGNWGRFSTLPKSGENPLPPVFLILSLFFSFIFSFIYSVGQIWLWQMRRNDQGYPRKQPWSWDRYGIVKWLDLAGM